MALQHHREQSGRNQQQVAAALGVLQPAYSRIESGDTSISVMQLRIVARTLRIAPARILNEADQWTQQLRRQGVSVTDEKPASKAAVAIG
jgi:transcriptional regulator with XRE-family HTH domain